MDFWICQWRQWDFAVIIFLTVHVPQDRHSRFLLCDKVRVASLHLSFLWPWGHTERIGSFTGGVCTQNHRYNQGLTRRNPQKVHGSRLGRWVRCIMRKKKGNVGWAGYSIQRIGWMTTRVHRRFNRWIQERKPNSTNLGSFMSEVCVSIVTHFMEQLV